MVLARHDAVLAPMAPLLNRDMAADVSRGVKAQVTAAGNGRRLVRVVAFIVLLATGCSGGGPSGKPAAVAEPSPQTSAGDQQPSPTPDDQVENPVSPVALNPGWQRVRRLSRPRFHAFVTETDQGLLVWGGNADASTNRLEPGYVEQWDGVLVEHSGQVHDLPTTPLCDHGQGRAVWTGSDLFVWNHAQATLPAGCPRAAKFSLASGEWNVPQDTRFFAAVTDEPVLWSGREILAWTEGLAFDPSSGRTRAFPPMPDFASFTGQGMSSPPAAHWAADRVLIQGSRNVIEYDPAAGLWREGPRPPIDGRALSSVWTGTHLLAVNYSMEAALYEPRTRTWEEIDEMPLRFYECLPDPVAAERVAFVHMCSGIAGWDGSGHWTLFPLPSRVSQPGQFIASSAALFHVGDEMLRYELPPKDSGRFERFPDFFPVGIFYLDVPEGWDVTRSDGTTNDSRTNADLALDLEGPDGKRCRISGHHGQLAGRHGDPAQVTRTRDGRTIEVVQKEETESEPAQVIVPHTHNTTDAVAVTCPSLPDALLLAAHLWTPSWPDRSAERS